MDVEVSTSPGAAATAHVAAAARRAVADRGRCTLALSGGSTATSLLIALAEADVGWPHVHLLQVDERIAPDGHPDRNLGALREHLLARVPIPPEQVHPMEVTGEDPDEAAERYAEVLAEVAGDPPTLDVVHLGLGADGHTASLVPGDGVLEVSDRPVAVTDRPYDGRRRITLTYPVLARARRVVWLVAGEEKAGAAARLAAGDPDIPASHVRRDRAVLVVDPAAAPPP